MIYRKSHPVYIGAALIFFHLLIFSLSPFEFYQYEKYIFFEQPHPIALRKLREPVLWSSQFIVILFIEWIAVSFTLKYIIVYIIAPSLFLFCHENKKKEVFWLDAKQAGPLVNLTYCQYFKQLLSISIYIYKSFGKVLRNNLYNGNVLYVAFVLLLYYRWIEIMTNIFYLYIRTWRNVLLQIRHIYNLDK